MTEEERDDLAAMNVLAYGAIGNRGIIMEDTCLDGVKIEFPGPDEIMSDFECKIGRAMTVKAFDEMVHDGVIDKNNIPLVTNGFRVLKSGEDWKWPK